LIFANVFQAEVVGAGLVKSRQAGNVVQGKRPTKYRVAEFAAVVI